MSPAEGSRAPGAPRAVVLGGTGFVGRHVCAAFGAAGYEVVAVSRGGRRPPGPPVRTAVLDLLDDTPEEIRGLLDRERPAVVVNATGAVWNVTGAQLTAVNVHGVARLLDALGRLRRPPRLVQLGSVHEYGAVRLGDTIDESSPETPSTEYGRTKLRGSRLVTRAAAAGAVDAVVLRISNAVGPGSPRGSLPGRVASQLGEAADRGVPALLRLSPLRARRDFVDVRDVADAVVAAAGRPVAAPVLNLGRGEAVSVRVLVTELIAAAGIEARIVEQGGEEARSAGVEWQQVSRAAARDALGWVPTRRLEDSLGALWEETRRTSRTS